MGSWESWESLVLSFLLSSTHGAPQLLLLAVVGSLLHLLGHSMLFLKFYL